MYYTWQRLLELHGRQSISTPSHLGVKVETKKLWAQEEAYRRSRQKFLVNRLLDQNCKKN